MKNIKSEELVNIIEDSPISIVVTDVNANITYVNSKFTSITGYTKKEVIGQNPKLLQSGQHSKQFYEEMWATLTSNNMWEGEIINKRKNGEIFYESAKIEAITDKNGKILHYVGIKEDITEKKRMQAQIRDNDQYLLVGQISMGIAHEFNNILGIIKSIVQLDLFFTKSKMDNNNSKEDIKRDLITIEEQVNRGAMLVSEIMQLGNPHQLEMKNTDITKLIDNIIEFEKKQLSKENIKIIKEYSDDISVIYCDPNKIKQVILNLLINAIHAMKAKGNGTLTITTKKNGDSLDIAICDTGNGIKNANIDKIFMPFFTTKSAYSTDSTGIKGTGLGLAICKRIINQHDGELSVESKYGKGTTFHIKLPIQKDLIEVSNKDDNIKFNTVDFTKLKRFSNMTVLLVDDEEHILENSEKYLTSIGIKNIFRAKSGEKSLDILQNNQIDIVFLNMVLPGIKGEQVYEKMIEIDTDIKIVFSTGQIHINPKDFLNKKNVYGFIKKPFGFSDMRNILEEIVG